MGLIGSIIAEGAAGAAEGAGLGTAKAAEKWTDALHEKAKQEAIALREENLARLNNAAAAERQQAGFGHAETMERDIRQPFERTQQQARFGNEKTLQDARLAYDRERDSENRTLTREQITSHEKIAQANNANAMAIAKIGGSVTQDTQGNVLWVGKDGKAQQIMDPNNPDKPLVGFKDLTPAAKAYADVIKDQLKGLDREELSAATTGDQAMQAKITERRGKLNADLLNVLTGGIGAAGKEAPAPGKTGWDSTSGKVYANGQEVGSAKSEAEARKIVEDARKKPAAPAAPASGGASGGSSATPAQPAARAQSAREYAPDLESSDPQLRALRVQEQSKDPTISAQAWIKYAARVKELKG